LLLEVLETAEPALGATRNQVQGLAHFWFDGQTVTAFNDILGIRVDLRTDFAGAVEGERLLGLLKNSGADGVWLIVEEDTLRLNFVTDKNVSTTEARLPLLDIRDRLFNEQFPEGDVFTVDQAFIDGIDHTLLSCGVKKIPAPAERGITMISDGDKAVDMYATDDTTVSWEKVPVAGRLFNGNATRAIWPKDFCEYFKKTIRSGSTVAVTSDAVFCQGLVAMPVKEEIAKDEDYLSNGRNTWVMVFSKLIEDEEPIDFSLAPRRFAGAIADGFALPKELGMALDRASVMMPDEQPVTLSVETDDDPVLRLSSENVIGGLDDPLLIEGKVNHEEVTVKVDVSLLRRSLSEARTRMAVTPQSLVLNGPKEFYHFIATRN